MITKNCLSFAKKKKNSTSYRKKGNCIVRFFSYQLFLFPFLGDGKSCSYFAAGEHSQVDHVNLIRDKHVFAIFVFNGKNGTFPLDNKFNFAQCLILSRMFK